MTDITMDVDTKALRQRILTLAIQGKLTGQRKEDGNARDLYNQIQEEKQKLIKEKKIKKTKKLPEITEDEIPFDIPENWMWARISDLFDVARGGSPRPIKSFLTDDPNGVNWIKIGDTEIGGKYISHVREKIKPEGVKKSRFVRSGDLLLTNSMSYGRPYILKTDGCIHDGWLMLSPILRSLNKEFFYYLSSSQYMKQEFTKAASGAVVKNLNKDKVKAISIPLPPLTEQKRIADKVSALFAQLDAIDKAYGEYRELQQTMKSRLLQQAIQGKLTDQRKEDGIAQDLYNQIQEEKQKLIKEKKIKKEKPLPEITADEIPFEIPENWMWVRLGRLITVISGVSYKKKDVCEAGVRILRGGNIQNLKVNISDSDVFLPNMYFDKTKQVKVGDVLIVASTGSKTVIGKPGYIEYELPRTMIGAFLRICRPICKETSTYLYRIFCSEYYRQHIRHLAQGTNINNVKEEYITKLMIPLPPLAEQKRIVEKLNKLLPLCEA